MKEYPEITIAQWEAALDSIKEFLGPYTVQFVGGEPFVKKGFLDLIGFCHERSIDFGVITNGSAFVSDHIVERFVAARPLKVEISVDGPTPEIHDVLRGATASLEHIAKGMANLREKQQLLGIRFPIRIKATLNAVNFRAMPDLVLWAADHGATTIDIEPIFEWTDESKRELWPREEDIHDLQGVLARLLDMKSAGSPIETSEHKLLGMIPYFRREKVAPEVTTCRIGIRAFSIDQMGIVRPCGEFATLGDLTRQTAREIWTGSVAREVRRSTVACTKGCAYGCKATKSLTQKIRRGLMVFGDPRS
jgi:MoaA/NifB/PqqE/SkfB family radical SAM enzyme